MIKIKCRECGCEISRESTIMEGNYKRYLSELKHIRTDECNTSIYLTCENGHFDKYHCRIELIS